jgi:hypothetical protein
MKTINTEVCDISHKQCKHGELHMYERKGGIRVMKRQIQPMKPNRPNRQLPLEVLDTETYTGVNAIRLCPTPTP